MLQKDQQLCESIELVSDMLTEVLRMARSVRQALGVCQSQLTLAYTC